MKRAFGVLAALVLLGGVAFALLKPSSDGSGPKTVTISGLIGSEKQDFFQDKDVKAELAAQGLVVNTLSVGSWQMVDKLDGQAFAFPASQAPADKIREKKGITELVPAPFYSPLVVVAHEATAQALKASGLAAEDPATHVWSLKMDAYRDALRTNRTWEQLFGGQPKGELRGTVLLSTTDPNASSSGAMYLALLSSLENRGPVSSDAEVDGVKDLLRTAITKQGSMQQSTDLLFKEFTSGGGKPLSLVYESEAAELVLQNKAPSDTVVLYPDTTIFSDHTLVGLNPDGRKLAGLLQTNAKLREAATRHGFRIQGDVAAFGTQLKSKDDSFHLAPSLRESGIVSAGIPKYDVLKKLTDFATKP
ncbi:hypothetical protein ACFVFS_01725 [Kitasatospora sp. NPDC057692]|uniref:hypothetical protein n=1 Tax=Kitasatospora sp. NPDC057692 TaxID=3346215 RepID=UPI00367ABECC